MKEGEPKGKFFENELQEDGQNSKNEKGPEEAKKIEIWEIGSYLEKAIAVYKDTVEFCDAKTKEINEDIAKAEKSREALTNQHFKKYADKVVEDLMKLRQDYANDKERALVMIEEYKKAYEEWQGQLDRFAVKTKDGPAN